MRRDDGHLFWYFSKEFALRVEAPTCLGVVTDALSLGGSVVSGEAGSYEEGNKLQFFWLVDKNGVVREALFQAFGDAVLIGCAETVCEMSRNRSLVRALSIEGEQLERMMLKEQREIPGRVRRLIALVLSARDSVCAGASAKGFSPHPEWESLSKEERLLLINETVQEYIQPHLHHDGGGLEILDLVDGTRVKILFQGACVDCAASSGSTLSYIQHVLRLNVHPNLVVEV